MLSNNKVKIIKSLYEKKYRSKYGLYIVEGIKMVNDAIKNREDIDFIVATERVLKIVNIPDDIVVYNVDDRIFHKISKMKTPQGIMAVLRIPRYDYNIKEMSGQTVLALDFIQDPGNLGTILRTAAWFGISHIVCSDDTVDVYNHKVVQASMGAIFKVKTYYTNLMSFIDSYKSVGGRVFAAGLNGQDIYTTDADFLSAAIILGNESKGVKPQILDMVDFVVSIPRFTEDSIPESLNVAVSAAVICSEIKRRLQYQ